MNKDSRIDALQYQELLSEKDKEIRELTKQISLRDCLLKSHGLEYLCTGQSQREESLSQPKSLKTWKACYGQKSKKSFKHMKAISNPVPLVFNIERLGSLPGRLGKTRKIGGSLAIKPENTRRSNKVEKEGRNTAKSQKNKVQESKKKQVIKKKTVEKHIKNENHQTPLKNEELRVYNIDFAQRSHSAPHRTSLKQIAREAYYIGHGNQKEVLNNQDDGELDISFISLTNSDRSINFNQNDLTLQKKLNPMEECSESACEKRLTFTGAGNLKLNSDRLFTDPYDTLENKENLELNSHNFNSPYVFDISVNESRLGLMNLVNEERNSIRIVDQFHLSNSKVMQEIECRIDMKNEAGFAEVKAAKPKHHRRNSTKFNLLNHVAHRQDEIYSRIERNIRSSYSSGKKFQAALSSIHGQTHNNSAEDLVLLGSLKKKNPFFRPSPLGQKHSKERYKELSKDNFTDES